MTREAEKIERLRSACLCALTAINTGRSEPLFIARDEITRTLEDCAALSALDGLAGGNAGAGDDELAKLRAAVSVELENCWSAANNLCDPYTFPVNDPRVELDRKVMVREGEAIAAMGERLQAALASPSPPKEAAQDMVSGWQPIETAPTNVSMLVFIPNAEHYGHGVYRAIHVDMGTGKRWHVSALHMGRDCGPDMMPTHWMQLPASPSAVDVPRTLYDGPDDGSCVLCGFVPRDENGLCGTCADEAIVPREGDRT